MVTKMFRGIVFASICALTGCGLLSPVKITPAQTYLLAPTYPASIPSTSKIKATILLTTPIAYPGYDTSQIAYMLAPYKLQYYANNRWAAPPAQMMLRVMADFMRHRGYFYAVVTPPFSGLTTYRLDTQLVMLQQEFFNRVSQVRLIVQANILNSDSNRILASRRFEAVVDAPKNDPYSGVLAANQALNTVSDQISQFAGNTIH